MRTAFRIVSLLLILAGAIFALQGANFIGGSVMSGDKRWLIIGIVMIIVGLVIGRWQSLQRPSS